MKKNGLVIAVAACLVLGGMAAAAQDQTSASINQKQLNAAQTEMVRLMNEDMAKSLFGLVASGSPSMVSAGSTAYATSIYTMQNAYNSLNSSYLDMINPQRVTARLGTPVKKQISEPEPDGPMPDRAISFED